MHEVNLNNIHNYKCNELEGLELTLTPTDHNKFPLLRSNIMKLDCIIIKLNYL